jgi:hypothetical protein
MVGGTAPGDDAAMRWGILRSDRTGREGRCYMHGGTLIPHRECSAGASLRCTFTRRGQFARCLSDGPACTPTAPGARAGATCTVGTMAIGADCWWKLSLTPLLTDICSTYMIGTILEHNY